MPYCLLAVYRGMSHDGLGYHINTILKIWAKVSFWREKACRLLPMIAARNGGKMSSITLSSVVRYPWIYLQWNLYTVINFCVAIILHSPNNVAISLNRISLGLTKNVRLPLKDKKIIVNLWSWETLRGEKLTFSLFTWYYENKYAFLGNFWHLKYLSFSWHTWENVDVSWRRNNLRIKKEQRFNSRQSAVLDRY